LLGAPAILLGAPSNALILEVACLGVVKLGIIIPTTRFAIGITSHNELFILPFFPFYYTPTLLSSSLTSPFLFHDAHNLSIYPSLCLLRSLEFVNLLSRILFSRTLRLRLEALRPSPLLVIASELN